MANEEHLAILRQGVDVWNRWRTKNPDVTPDLEQADFRNAKLRYADLQNAKLRRTDLEGAGLEGAFLRRADLRRVDLQVANLEGASLEGAVLRGADLDGANLTEANLTGASLTRTNLTGTNLTGANLRDARIRNTLFIDVDLQTVQNLDRVHHGGPSHISIDTLYRSQGQIPESFLRGCGVPDSMIEYARSLVVAERPIDYYSVFISYSSHDEALAERLYADLQAKGVRCWLAPHDLTPGEVIVRGIDEAIRLHDKVVLLLSEAAVTSHWVAYEVNLATTREAREGRTVLYPLRLDDAVLTAAEGWATTLRDSRHIGDFRQWTEYAAYHAVFGRLLRDLKAGQE